jgi:tRNA pseudouridine65 synthase
MEIPVLYRDDRLIAVSKPSGLVVHRGWARDKVTLYDIVRDELVGSQVFAVHRLDRGTSGVMMFALDAETARLMQEEIEAGRVHKQYLALVRGPMTDRFFINHPIQQPDVERKVPALTEFRPLAHCQRWTLVAAMPITGRSHQIRLHLKHLNHPIIGDVKYGKGEINRMFRSQYGLSRMALHSAALSIRHPHTGERLEMKAALPEDLTGPLAATGFDQSVIHRLSATESFTQHLA